jgi:hypothetical protein
VARDAAWERAWQLAGDATPGTGGGLVTVDLDATLVTALSEAVRGSPAARPAAGSAVSVLVLISGQLWPAGSGRPSAPRPGLVRSRLGAGRRWR